MADEQKLTAERARAAGARMRASIESRGCWEAVCGACGAVAGVWLAEHCARPALPESLCCGACDNGVSAAGAFRLEFVPGSEGEGPK